MKLLTFKKKSIFSYFVLVAVILGMFTLLGYSPVRAAREVGGQIFDNFSHLPALKPALNAKFWIVNLGDDGNGNPGRYEDYCGDGTCLTHGDDGNGDKFIRLSQFSNQTPNLKYSLKVKEQRDRTPDARWKPEPGKPVILSTRIKFSDNYQAEGSGDAVGSAGIWLDNVEGGFGILWTTDKSIIFKGLQVGVLATNQGAIKFESVYDVNLQDWIKFRVEWYEDAQGVQTFKFFVNDVLRSEEVLTTPLPYLGLDIWNDNQKLSGFDENGLIITFDSPTAQQDFDVDFIRIRQ